MKIRRSVSISPPPHERSKGVTPPVGGYRLALMIALFFPLPGWVPLTCGAADKGEPAVVALGAVVVTAERLQEYVKHHPQDVKVVGRPEIVERNLGNVEEILKTMAGVEVVSTPGAGSRISIRGSGQSGSVLVLVNGRPLNSNQYGSQDLSAIPVDSIQSVSVFKPPVPVWLGPGGSNGAINIVTSAEPGKGDAAKVRSTVKVNGGSYGFGEGSLSHPFSLADGNALVAGVATHRDGSRTNSDRTSESLSFNWNRPQKDGSSVEVSSRLYQAEYGSPGPVDNLTPDARQEYHKVALDAKYTDVVGETGTLAATVYGDAVTLEDRAQSGLKSTLDDHKIGIKADTLWSREDGAGDLRLGMLSEWDGFEHTLAGEHHRFRNSLNSQYDRSFGTLTPTVGVRGDLTNDFGLNPGALAGVGWGISKKWLLKLKGGYTVNVPTFEQLYQTTHGSIDQSRGNPNLLEERVWNSDLGAEYTFAKDRSVQVTLFRADTFDLITSERGPDLIYRPINLARAVRQGVELTGKVAWKNGLIFEPSCIVQDSENKDTGKKLPYTPALKVKSTLRYTLARFKTRLEGTVRYEGSRFSQVENLPAEEMDAYVVADFKATQPFTLAGLAVEGTLRVDNIGNTSYATHFGYPADGLVVMAGMQVKF